MNTHLHLFQCRTGRWFLLSARLVPAILVSWMIVLLPSATAHADSGSGGLFQKNFCWNYWIADCPDDIDFYWRARTFLSPVEPADSHDWVSLVAPAKTYFFYSPMPSGKHRSWDFGLIGFGWDWWVMPASLWWLQNGVQPGLVVAPEIASTFTSFDRSSYGQPNTAPSGEPGFMSRTTAFWYGDLWEWHWVCSWWPPGCYKVWQHYPMFAWRTRVHPVPVRQLHPVSIGS